MQPIPETAVTEPSLTREELQAVRWEPCSGVGVGWGVTSTKPRMNKPRTLGI